MANPQKENGYTAVANEITEHLMAVELSGANHRVVMAIMRKTYGFQKKEDEISLSQFVEATKLSKRTIVYNLQDLEAKKIIIVVRRTEGSAKLSNIYSFNKDYDTWVVQNSAPQVIENRKQAKRRSAKLRKEVVQNSVNDGGGSAKLGQKVVQNSVKKVNSFAHTKEKRKTKERIPAKVPVGTLVGNEWNEIIDAFKPVNEFFEKFYANKTQRQAIVDIVKKVGKEKLLWVITHLVHTNKKSYFPVINTPVQLRDKWTALSDALIRYKGEQTTKKQSEQKVDKFGK